MEASWLGGINLVKTATLAIAMFTAIHIKIPMSFLTYMEAYRPQTANAILSRNMLKVSKYSNQITLQSHSYKNSMADARTHRIQKGSQKEAHTVTSTSF